jgi:hypothetical protein
VRSAARRRAARSVGLGYVPRGAVARPTRRAGLRLAGFVYGTIIVLAVIVEGAFEHPFDPGEVAEVAAATCLVLWVAHVYAHALATSVTQERHLSRRMLWSTARLEAPIVEAALLPVVVLVLGAIGLLSAEVSLWVCLGVGLAILAVEGVAFARAEQLGRLASFGVVGVNIVLGLVLVSLKVFVAH